MRRAVLFTFLTAVVFLAACAAPSPTARNAAPDVALPKMNSFAPRAAPPVTRSNSSIANDFMSLAFELESGRRLPVLSRFEGPITIRVTGAAPATLATDLRNLLSRLRNEAGINITQVAGAQAANITIDVISSDVLQRFVPNAACFVAPRVSSWNEFKATRRGPTGDWAKLVERQRMAIFLPGDVSPQEIRDCLHEELAQTLGPVNDMFHLTDSIFNDDNFHAVLTGFDMLVLRAFYAPELRSGMSADGVAARLPDLLRRLNPGGGSVGQVIPARDNAAWKDAINTALGANGTSDQRAAANRAVAIAQSMGWRDHRLAFSLFAQGRLSLSTDSPLALNAFLQAEQIYDRDPATAIHAAHVAVQTAAYALSSRQPQYAVDLVNAHLGAVLRGQNASLLATLLFIKAEALDDLGQPEDAAVIRLDALGWARYGIGSDRNTRRRLAEIAALSPPSQRAAQ